MSPEACVSSSSGPPFPVFMLGFLAIFAACFAPVWVPALVEYFGPLGRAERMRERELKRRTAELVALGVEPYDAKQRASRDMLREANEVLAVQASL